MFTTADGTYYDGEWSGGLREGRGMMLYSDGRKYTGHWKANKVPKLPLVTCQRRLERGSCESCFSFHFHFHFHFQFFFFFFFLFFWGGGEFVDVAIQ